MNDTRRTLTALRRPAVYGAGLLVVVAIAGLATGALDTGADAGAPTQQIEQEAEQTGYSGMPPLSDADTIISGAGANATTGWAVADAGDVNGDGVDDLLVGAPGRNATGTRTGAAYIFFGPVDRDEIDVADADVTLRGAASYDRAGHAVSTAGDLNDDGYADVIVGAPGNDSTAVDAGAAYIVYGGPSLPATRRLTEADVTLQGSGQGDRAGWSVSNASDVDGGDGVLVGAPLANDDAGVAYIVGSDTNDVAELAGAATATRRGERDGDMAGWSVADAGDLNGDGVHDIVVGASNWTADGNPRARSDTASAGAAYVVYGPVVRRRSLATADLRLRGVDPRDRAGYAVSSAGDLNDDGDDDLLVGAPYADPDGRDEAGTAYVVHGAENLQGDRSLSRSSVVFTGERADDNAGFSVAGARDVTCDGVDDALIGAPGDDTGGTDAGAAYVVTGSSSLSRTTSLRTAEKRVYGERAGDAAGRAVSAAGDLDDDGHADIVVGVPFADRGGTKDAGAAAVLLTDCPRRPSTGAPPPPPSEPVDVEVSCSADGGELTVRNPGDRSVRVVVTRPDGHDRRVTVAAGDRARFTDLENGQYRVRTYTANDRRRKIGDETVRIECPTEAVDVRRRCTDDGGKLRVTNPNDEAVRVVVDGPNGYENRVRVAANSHRTFDDLDDGSYRIETRATAGDGGYRIASERVRIDCGQSLAPIRRVDTRVRCRDDAGRLTVENGNDRSVTVDVEGPSLDRRVRVSAGSTRTFSGLDDGEYRVQTIATINGNRYRIDRTTVTVDCVGQPRTETETDTDTATDTETTTQTETTTVTTTTTTTATETTTTTGTETETTSPTGTGTETETTTGTGTETVTETGTTPGTVTGTATETEGFTGTETEGGVTDTETLPGTATAESPVTIASPATPEPPDTEVPPDTEAPPDTEEPPDTEAPPDTEEPPDTDGTEQSNGGSFPIDLPFPWPF